MSSGGDDEAKKLILARRARFVAAAVAMNAVMCGGETEGTQGAADPQEDGGVANPQPCLAQRPKPEDDGGVPQPCLSPIAPDAGTDAGDSGVPQPCLSLPPPDAGS